MNWLEILLIIGGATAFVGSFIIKGKPEKTNEPVQIDSDIIKTLVNKEMNDAKERVSEVVDETLTYAVEKTERASERISNEKIMAINEYSDTVLADINKSHQEVLFLYDMLNNKHEEIKETVKQVDKATKELAKELEEKNTQQQDKPADKNIVDKNVVDKKPVEKKAIEKKPVEKSVEKNTEKGFEVYSFAEQAPHIVRNEESQTNRHKTANLHTVANTIASVDPEPEKKPVEEKVKVDNVIVEMKPEASANNVSKSSTVKTVSAFSVVAAENKDDENVEIIEIAENTQDSTQQPENNNDRILEMHREGMSNVDIAKELGLGVGEVKLVINLFKGAV